MNTQNSKKSMEATNGWKNTFILTILLGILFPAVGKADSIESANPLIDDNCISVTSRPLSHFLNTQGTLNNPPQFFPVVKDYAGWAGGDGVNFALVDYAGLANKYIKANSEHSIGTKVNGFVLECALPNGKAQITVQLLTKKALGFAQSIEDLANNEFNFLNTPTIFGAKAQDVVNGEKPATGLASLSTTFSIAAPGADLPDFIDVVFNPASYAPVKMNFKSITFGKCSNGRKARLNVHQVGSTNDQNVLVFTKEKVDIVDEKGGDCRN